MRKSFKPEPFNASCIVSDDLVPINNKHNEINKINFENSIDEKIIEICENIFNNEFKLGKTEMPKIEEIDEQEDKVVEDTSIEKEA